MKIFFTVKILLFFCFILSLSPIRAMDKKRRSFVPLPYQQTKRKKIERYNYQITPTINQISQINNFNAPIDTLTYDEKNNIIAISSGNDIRFFDIASGTFLHKYARKKYQCEYYSIAFTQDSKLFGSYCFGNYITLWNKENKKITCFPTLPSQQYAPLKFNNGLLLFPYDNNLMIYDLNNKMQLKKIHRPTTRTALLSPDASKLATILQDDHLQIENWPTMNKIIQYKVQNVSLLRWSPDSQQLAISYAKEQKSYINIFDIEKGTKLELDGHFCSWDPTSNFIFISDKESYLKNEKITTKFCNISTNKNINWHKSFKASKNNAKLRTEWTKKYLFLTTQDSTVHLLHLPLPIEFLINVIRMQSNTKFADVTFQF